MEGFHPDNSRHKSLLHVTIIAATTAATVLLSLYCLFSGFFILFQNFFYIPIVLSCLYYTFRGFIYSVCLSVLYLILMLSFTSESNIVLQALARTGIFIVIAGIVSFLSARRRQAMQKLHEKEKVLKLSETRLSNIIEFLPDATFVIDLEGKIISWNRAIEEMTGFSAETMLGKGNYEYSIPFYGERRPILVNLLSSWNEDVARKYSFIDRKGDVFLTETDMPSVRGQQRTLWAAASFLRDNQGNIIGAIESVRDITDRKQIEKALEDSEQKFRSIFDNAVEGIFQTAPEGRFINVNSSMARMHGFATPEEMLADVTDIGRQLYVNPEDRERYRTILEESGEINGYEAQVYRKDGSIIWTSTSARAVRDALGNIIRFEGTTEDITIRKRAEEILEENRNELQWLFKSMINAFVLFESVFDDTGKFVSYRFVYINDAYENITGVKNDEVRGKTVHEVWPETEPEWIKRYGEVAVTGVSQTFDLYHEPTKKLYHCNVYRPWNTKERFCVIFEDITERMLAEEKIKKSEQKFRSIFENAVEGIFQTSPDGKLLSINPAFARMTGYSSPEEMVDTIVDLDRQVYVNAEDRELFKKIIEENGHITGFETQHYRKDGSKIWVSINARCVYDEKGKVIHYEGTFENITKRKQAEEELKQTLEKLRSSLMGTINALSSTVETRDPYTAGHQRQVSSLAYSIAREMNLPDDVVDKIRMAGILHDIGKISVPAELLAKPTQLTDIEMNLIKVHAQSGYNILKDVGLPYPIAEIVLQHHERLDGSGYPQGLKADQILLEAKILSVADVVEATAANRPYRPALGIDVALKEIESNGGTLYDKSVVEACLKLFREGRFRF